MVVVGFLLAAEVASAPSQFVRWSLEIGYPGWLRGPLDGLAEPITVKGFIGLTVLLYGLYLVVVWTAEAVRTSWALVAIGALHLIFLLGPPMYLTDVFNYLGFARLDVLHGLTPYAHHPSAVPGDAVFPYVTWPDITSPYGPLFTLGSYATAPLGIAGGVWAYKVLGRGGEPGLRVAGVAAGPRARPPPGAGHRAGGPQSAAARLRRGRRPQRRVHARARARQASCSRCAAARRWVPERSWRGRR